MGAHSRINMQKYGNDAKEMGQKLKERAEVGKAGGKEVLRLGKANLKVGKEKLAKLRGKPGDLFKDGVETLSKEDLFEGRIKYIAYTRRPKVHGIAPNTEANVPATMLQVFDTHDAINLS